MSNPYETVSQIMAERDQLRAELAALKAGQGEAVACLVRSRHMSTPARLAHDGKDHFTPWGEWEPGTLAYGEAVTDAGRNTPCLYEMRPIYTAPPASADAVSVPRELLDDEGLEAIQEWASGEDQTVNIGQVQGDFDEHIESTAGYAVRLMKKLRAILAQSQGVKS